MIDLGDANAVLRAVHRKVVKDLLGNKNRSGKRFGLR